MVSRLSVTNRSPTSAVGAAAATLARCCRATCLFGPGSYLEPGATFSTGRPTERPHVKSTDKAHLIDDAPLTSFHKKLTAYSSGGPFIDGYALTVIGIALLTAKPALHLTDIEIGLVGAASLVGVFVGGLVFGYVTDLIGRKVMYVADLVVLAVASVGSAFAPNAWWLIALRFIAGVAIGADYPIATALLAEYLPRRHRGRLLGLALVFWTVGAAAAYAVGFLLRDLGPDTWRWLLASPALFAVITLLLRFGTPESARWLLSKGRVEEANAAIKKSTALSTTSAIFPTNGLPAPLSARFSESPISLGPYLCPGSGPRRSYHCSPSTSSLRTYSPRSA